MGNGIAAYKISLKKVITQTPQIERKNSSRLYPVETRNSVTLESYEPIRTIKIYNSTGMQLLSVNGNNSLQHKIDIGHFVAGMYYIRINNQSGLRVIKK